MNPQPDAIVDIPAHRLKYFGGPGKMLLPSPATVAALIEEVPDDKLVTTNLICRELAGRFNVRGTCPVTTKKAVQTLAKTPGQTAPVWRVIQQNGGLMTTFPGGTRAQAARLRQAGFKIETVGDKPRVRQYQDSLASFA